MLGSTTEPVPQAPDVPLSIFGQYDDAQLPALLAAEKPDVIFFPAQVPETYSYTLSVALASGVPIVASSLGALPERIAGHDDVDGGALERAAGRMERGAARRRPASTSPGAAPARRRAASGR